MMLALHAHLRVGNAPLACQRSAPFQRAAAAITAAVAMALMLKERLNRPTAAAFMATPQVTSVPFSMVLWQSSFVQPQTPYQPLSVGVTVPGLVVLGHSIFSTEGTFPSVAQTNVQEVPASHLLEPDPLQVPPFHTH
mmetsp:Transcript_132545/g.330560  ORF Transcript_132545/g.330560 Transcript_132545/m.330560 type:complete len:137 (+) Transcript_132545:269-679(+)